MYNRISIHTIAQLLTTLFILVRIGNFHGLSHLTEDDDKIMHCELCDMLLQSEDHAPSDIPQDVYHLSFNIFIESVERPQANYVAPVHCFVTPDFVFNKPPPTA